MLAGSCTTAWSRSLPPHWAQSSASMPKLRASNSARDRLRQRGREDASAAAGTLAVVVPGAGAVDSGTGTCSGAGAGAGTMRERHFACDESTPE